MEAGGTGVAPILRTRKSWDATSELHLPSAGLVGLVVWKWVLKDPYVGGLVLSMGHPWEAEGSSRGRD